MQSRLMVSSPICLAGLFFQPLLVVHNWMSLYSQLEVEFLPFLMISSFCSALRWAGSVYLLILDWERERAEREREKKIFSIFYVWMYDAKWWWRCKPTRFRCIHHTTEIDPMHNTLATWAFSSCSTVIQTGLLILSDSISFLPTLVTFQFAAARQFVYPISSSFLIPFFFLCWSFFVVITEPVDKLLVEPDWLSSWQW